MYTAEQIKQAMDLATQLAEPLAKKEVERSALGDGQFLKVLLEIIKVLLPIILQILNPPTSN